MPIIPPGTYSSARRVTSAKPNGRWTGQDISNIPRARSPISMQTYLQNKLREETREKVNAQVDVEYLRCSLQWFSSRLSEILKGSNLPNTCLLEVVALHARMQALASEHGHNQCNEDSFASVRELAKKEELDGDILDARFQVQQLNKELARKRIEGTATISRYEEEIRKLSSLHKDEVGGLRNTVSNLTSSLDKWKDMYSKDISRLERQLHNKDFDQRTVKRTLKTT